MKYKISFLLPFLLTISAFTFGQEGLLVANFSNAPVFGEKWSDLELVIPIQVELENTKENAEHGYLSLNINNYLSVGTNPTQITESEASKLEVRNNGNHIIIDPKQKVSRTFYLVIKKDLLITNNKTLHFNLIINDNFINSTVVNLKRGNDITYTLSDYLDNKELKLDYVSNVTSSNNVLTLYGYRGDNNTKINITLDKRKVLAISDKSIFWEPDHWSPFPLSLTTIPFKMRRGLEKTNESNETFKFNRSATSGLTNLGFNLDMAKYQMDRYFSNGKKSTHKFSIGVWAAPSVEELDSVSTVGYLGKDVKSKQLFVSTGLTVSYTYNDISFVWVPYGWDIGTSTIGKEWVYNRERWFGFGIAVSPKIFATVLNK